MRATFIAPALILLALTACGGSKEDNQVTETRLDDLDSLEGTISDDMINTDESTDEAPVEAAPPAETKTTESGDKDSAKKAEDTAPAKTDDKAATE